ncbi:signal peptidase I [Vagococcus sp.]|uniref:signal peptidase I n=1 Tax=Vagococcus sp. TaxID=1933889 RepID=UPI003F97972C
MKTKQKKRTQHFFIFVFLLIFLIIILLLGFIVPQVKSFKIPDNSMYHQLVKGEHIIYKENFIPQRFNIVLVKHQDEIIPLRIIGLPGDEVKMLEDTLLINKQEYREPYLKENFLNYKAEAKNYKNVYTENFDMRNIHGSSAQTLTIPQNNYLVLGDNRRQVKDSRDFGLVSRDQLKGVTLIRYYPLKKMGPLS